MFKGWQVLNLRRYWSALASIAAVPLIVLPSLALSPTFQACVQTIPDYNAAKHQGESLPYFLFFDWRFAGCSGPFVDVNASAIVAVFTIVLTLSTVGLWLQTERLAKGAELQARDSRRAQRPFLNIENFHYRVGRDSYPGEPDTDTIYISYEIKNFGVGPAFLSGLNIHTRYDRRSGVNSIPGGSIEISDFPGAILASGETFVDVMNRFGFGENAGWLDDFLGPPAVNKRQFYLVGSGQYFDFFGVTRESGFLFMYNGNLDRFVPVTDQTFWYDREV